METYVFWLNLAESCLQESNWQYDNIGLDNDLVPLRRQPTIRTNIA